jgi:hypothetical protein
VTYRVLRSALSVWPADFQRGVKCALHIHHTQTVSTTHPAVAISR